MGSEELEGRNRAAERLRLAVGLFVAALLALLLTDGISVREAIGLSFFYLFLPAVGWAQLPLLPGVIVDRVEVYTGSAVTLVLLGLIAIGVGVGAGPTGETYPHMIALPPLSFLLWTAALTVAGLVVIVAFEPVERLMPSRGAVLVRQLLPTTRREKWTFAALSIVAGIGEELAYRGYALAAAERLFTGAWPAALVSTVPFALLHAYQGPAGIFRTGVVGFAFAASVVVTGSLVPAMVAHALVDIAAGLVVGPWLLGEEREEDD